MLELHHKVARGMLVSPQHQGTWESGTLRIKSVNWEKYKVERLRFLIIKLEVRHLTFSAYNVHWMLRRSQFARDIQRILPTTLIWPCLTQNSWPYEISYYIRRNHTQFSEEIDISSCLGCLFHLSTCSSCSIRQPATHVGDLATYTALAWSEHESLEELCNCNHSQPNRSPLYQTYLPLAPLLPLSKPGYILPYCTCWAAKTALLSMIQLENLLIWFVTFDFVRQIGNSSHSRIWMKMNHISRDFYPSHVLPLSLGRQISSF